MEERDTSAQPFFSVIIPTRNRPELFRRALGSVLRQSCPNIEVLVVNDGSSDEFLPRYRAMEEDSDSRVSWHYQPQRPNGHGPSYSINTGAQAARGRYLCILDDDDSWEDVEHLARARDVLDAAGKTVDVYYSNQRAYTADGTPVDKRLWLEGLAAKLPPSGAGMHGTYPVTPAFLLSSNGFPHLNCTIIRRELYLEIGGMDEGIRYECEVDLYLRTLDAAQELVYDPAVVARHNIPDKVARTSVSTAVDDLQKCLSQITVYQKNLARTPAEPIRTTCLHTLSMLYKRLAEHFVAEGEFVIAARYARIALACRWSVKWWLYSLYLAMRAMHSAKE
ncbi:MAG: glycosyltransferase family A protein [Pseudohongiellaceae bacterium]